MLHLNYMKIKANKEFITLYNEAEDIKADITALLSETSGYATMWVEKNFPKAYDSAKGEKKELVDKLIRKANAIKGYAWSKFFYENVDTLPAIDVKKITYDAKTKTIIIPKPSLFAKLLDKISKTRTI